MRIVIPDIPCMTSLRPRFTPVLLMLFLALTSVQGQGKPQSLSKTEQRIVSAVEPDVPEGLALLERLVNINSGTMNFAGVRQVAEALRIELEALGFRVRWVNGAAFGRAGQIGRAHV